MLTTSYIDLRDKDERMAIRSLVKGCKREHALENNKALLISKQERFREYGVELFRDEQEGFAKEEFVTLVLGPGRFRLGPAGLSHIPNRQFFH